MSEPVFSLEWRESAYTCHIHTPKGFGMILAVTDKGWLCFDLTGTEKSGEIPKLIVFKWFQLKYAKRFMEAYFEAGEP